MPSLFDLNLLEIESLCDPHFLTTLSLTLCGSCHCLKLGFRDLWKLTVGWQSPSGLMHHFPTKTATLKSICHCTKLGAASHLVRGRKLFGEFFFFSLGNFFWISGSHHFPCYLQHFGAGNCHFHGMCNGFEFEPLIFHCIFHGICNSLQHVLSIFHALCSIFELESAFPPYVQHFTATFLTVLAGFWS